ncbi:MAG: PRC-barrel domain-containing protein [Coriobacteriia bacterium]|nr:PRC-barrel domain-containing protein [Coriobacteriia bacterium]MBN2839436.1 PRC-barrel domain-containing protein [Coriobacteriia bacterium]
MPSITMYERRAIVGQNGRQLGRVSAVLFHPSEPRVVGVQVDRGAILGVIDQRPRYVPLDDLRIAGDEALAIEKDALPKDNEGERALGYSWDESVIWHGMPVSSTTGEQVGTVNDAEFDASTGEITVLRVSTGAVGDLAVGRLEVPRAIVRGFVRDAVVVEAGYAELTATGGAAKAAASGVTALKERSGQVADGMMQVGVAAAGALGRSLKSGVGRKAIDKMKSLMDDEE